MPKKKHTDVIPAAGVEAIRHAELIITRYIGRQATICQVADALEAAAIVARAMCGHVKPPKEETG